MSDEGCGAFLVVFIGVLVLILIGMVCFDLHASFHTSTAEGTVVEKPVDEGNIYFVVEFKDGSREVFSNNDNMAHGKFNSRDFIAKIEIGKTYQFRLSGYRVPFLSMHRNILEVKEVKTND